MKKGEMLGKMIVLATNAHADQYDRAGQPYILHCLKVLHYTGSDDEEIQCIAVGHDIIEDTDTTFDDLYEAGMTDRVVKAIARLTKMPGQSYQAYKQGVLECPDARMVKKADLKHNSDVRRLKGVTQKDIDRNGRYMQFYAEIEAADAENSS